MRGIQAELHERDDTLLQEDAVEATVVDFWRLPWSPYDQESSLFLHQCSFPKKSVQLKFISIEDELLRLTNTEKEVLVQNQEANQKQIVTTIQLEEQNLNDCKMGESKNIPKNYGKHLIKFVNKNERVIKKILAQINSQLKYEQLNGQLQRRKKRMNKIGDLRELWLQKTTFGREMRIISMHFLRKRAFQWIFNSRVTSVSCHLKYRKKLSKLIRKPQSFINLSAEL